MPSTYFFYDLETSGINPRDARIMQFAGQRTDMQLQPIGEPQNHLIRLSEDAVPDPEAILITGITPQQTLAEGITEVEFLRLFYDEIATPETIFVGYNSVRFDDEFMRYLHYRNFYDPYEWQYKENRSRWDLLDVARMTRALRPDGIAWPFDDKGNPTNRLELLTAANSIEHSNAHDALSDVHAVIDLARLIRGKQPKLFDYLLTLRNKKQAESVARSGQPFLYTSGKYANEWQKTTAVGILANHPQRQGVLVFDLRYDPLDFAGLSADQLAESWRIRKDEPGVRLPVKLLQFNRCPAVAPLSVLDSQSAVRLKLDAKTIQLNYKKLMDSDLSSRVLEALKIVDKQLQAKYLDDDSDVYAKLYEGFFGEGDRNKMSMLRAADVAELAKIDVGFTDERLQALLPLYKARNFPNSMSDEDRATWERFRERRLLSGKQASRLAQYFARLGDIAKRPDLSKRDSYLLEELELYGQSIMPTEAE